MNADKGFSLETFDADGTGESEFSGLLTKSKITKTQTWQIKLPGAKIDLSSGIKHQQQDRYCKH